MTNVGRCVRHVDTDMTYDLCHLVLLEDIVIEDIL